MNHQSLGSAVYLNNVDDYNGLSQACVNPIFMSNDTRPTGSSDQPQASSVDRNKETNEVPPHNQHRSGVRSRRGRPRVDISSPLINTTTNSATNPTNSLESSLSTTTEINGSKNSGNTSDVVTATIADCLACSGCITTAETVLLQEQHSLAKLKEHLFQSFPTSRPAGVDAALRPPVSDEQYTPKQIPTVLTISPASMADLCRCLLHPEAYNSEIEETTTNQHASQQREQLLLQLTAVLHEYLNINAVMDGTVTLYTTLQIAADEFCQAFQYNNSKEQRNAPTIPNEEEYERQLLPSVALSSKLTQYWIPPTIYDDDQSKSTTNVAVVDRSECTSRIQQSLPILSSSCPAIVCLVEKSYPAMVPHLSTTISPMIAAARQFWNPVVPMLYNKPVTTTTPDQQYVDNLRMEFFHLAVMPCHDKKLEASRHDFRTPYHDDGSNTSLFRSNVDMVITTMELMQLLYDAITMRNQNYVETTSPPSDGNMTGNAMYAIVRQTILSFPNTPSSSKDHLPMAIDCTSLVTTNFQHATRDAFLQMLQQQVSEYTYQNRPILFTMSIYQMSKPAEMSPASTSSALNVTGSGGYADYIFRYIAKNYFGLDCPNDTSIWIPIADEENVNRSQDNNPAISSHSQNAISRPLPKRMSVRTARQRKQREYYEAIIFRNNETQQHFVATSTFAAMRNDSTIVLRFVIAYGMSLVQTVLSKLSRSYDGDTTQQQQQPDQQVDYMECMACTHSCLNGNGQIRSGSNNAAVVIRETPLDIKLRVQRTHHYYPIQQYHVTATTYDTESSNDVDMINNSENLYRNDPVLYTRYHIVPPMQHTMGVAAGIAVQDTQW